MRRGGFALAGIAAVLAACSPEPQDADTSPNSGEPFTMTPSPEVAQNGAQALVDMLVDRFDAPECLQASTLAMMRKTDPDGAVVIVRAYEAPLACADQLKTAFETLGFAEKEAGLYHGSSADGTTERVSVKLADDGSAAGIEWEIDQK
ncbi:MAG: hypothetical protein AAFQ13_01785 [Pseudomonadota bacterium]